MSKADEDENDSSRSIWVTAGIVFILVVGLWVATPLVMEHFLGEALDKRGQAGDQYGSINALFTGLAMAGMVMAIMLQRKELSLQRKELRETREELKNSTAAQNKSQEALNKTIWAQSLKVALDIIEEPRIITARALVIRMREDIKKQPPEAWPGDVHESIELVARSFETIGTMIRKGLLPADYILDTWSVPIVRQWDIIGSFCISMRAERLDPFISTDFEHLARAANDFLLASKVPGWKQILDDKPR